MRPERIHHWTRRAWKLPHPVDPAFPPDDHCANNMAWFNRQPDGIQALARDYTARILSAFTVSGINDAALIRSVLSLVERNNEMAKDLMQRAGIRADHARIIWNEVPRLR